MLRGVKPPSREEVAASTPRALEERLAAQIPHTSFEIGHADEPVLINIDEFDDREQLVKRASFIHLFGQELREFEVIEAALAAAKHADGLFGVEFVRL